MKCPKCGGELKDPMVQQARGVYFKIWRCNCESLFWEFIGTASALAKQLG